MTLEPLGGGLRLRDAGAEDEHLLAVANELDNEVVEGVLGLDPAFDQLAFVVVGEQQPAREGPEHPLLERNGALVGNHSLARSQSSSLFSSSSEADSATS